MKLLQDILEVLVVVHQRNIIHRDIKSQNIMRRRQDGKIVLIDFGAVKEIGTLAVNTQGQVRSTITIGTPGYMPSEQANRDPKLCSDIYAVGIIGIQALTGLLPQQLLQDPTTGELNWRNYVEVSDNLADIITKMVRYHFSQRYQSAFEALQALNTLTPQPKPTRITQRITLIPQLPQSFRQSLLIGLGGLGMGVLATVLLINRPQSTIPPVIPSPTPTLTGSPSPTPTVASTTINFAIAPQFDSVGAFSEALAEVKVNGKWGYIDKNGTMVIQPQFDETQGFSEGLALVWIAGKNWGYIDKTGKFVIPQQFAKNQSGKFSQGLAYACIASTCGYIDKTGRFVIDRKFTGRGDFLEGLAAIKIGNKWGYIDKTSNTIIQQKFDEVSNFAEGLATIKIGDKWGYIDNTGNTVIPPQFDDTQIFSEELAAVKIGNKWGYIDKTGNTVISRQFDAAYRFSEKLAAVKINGKWGYIDKTGKTIIPPQFDDAYNFSEGLALVKINDKWGYIDKIGNTVIPPQFAYAGGFSAGLAWVRIGDNKYGYIRNPLK